MLHFFRTYQKGFFWVVTILTVIVFAFFGTQSTLNMPVMRDQTAFRAVEGSQVSDQQLEMMARLLDSEFPRAMDPTVTVNVLNDGVVSQDLLETGIGVDLAGRFSAQVYPEVRAKLSREEGFQGYQHPQAPFFSAQLVWNTYAPDLAKALVAMQSAREKREEEAFEARVRGFLAEREFPSAYLRNALAWQMQQMKWIQQDPNLRRIDLRLFGYEGVKDWFGQNFSRLAAAFVLNSARVAESEGYEVTEEEVEAALRAQAERVIALVKEQRGRPPTVEQLIQGQARALGASVDQLHALWRDVLLMRRLFATPASGVFVDRQMFEEFDSFAFDRVEGVAYMLPAGWHVADVRRLNLLDAYLQAVARGYRQSELQLPRAYKGVEEIANTHPQLLQKRVLVQLSTVPLARVEGRPGVRDVWGWQVEETNFARLAEAFPSLGKANPSNEAERIAALESLDMEMGQKVDRFSREAIAASHPEWIEEAFSNAKPEEKILFLRKKGEEQVLPGISTENFQRAMEEGNSFSVKGSNAHYRIEVLDQSPEWEVLPFAQAVREGVFGKSVEEEHDISARLDLLRVEYLRQNPDAEAPSDTELAGWQGVLLLRKAREALQKGDDVTRWVQQESAVGEGSLPPATSLEGQWKLLAQEHGVRRSELSAEQGEGLFVLEEGALSEILEDASGAPWFFAVRERKRTPDYAVLMEQVTEAQRTLGNGVKRLIGARVIDAMVEEQSYAKTRE